MRLIGPRVRDARKSILVTIVWSLVLLGMVLLPDLGPKVSGPQVVEAWHGRLTAILDPHRPDPTGTGGGFLPDAEVLILEGPRVGETVEAYRQGPGGQADSNAYRVGEDVVVTMTDVPDGSTFVAVADRWRLPQLSILVVLFALGVGLVGGWRGVRALLALALTIAIILKGLIPLLVAGIPPIPAAVVIATGLVILSIGLTGGLGRASVAAILGTAAALALTGLLAAVATAFAGFTNTLGSELVSLALPNGQGLDLRGLLLAAFMIGSVGVLDDVTVTQATAVEELARTGLRGRELFGRAFNVGRSHLAATVNTLFLAYAGASLPVLVLLVVSSQPTTLLLNGEAVAIEIVRSLVGSLGIVAAIPLTTVIAAWLATDDPSVVLDAASAVRQRSAPAWQPRTRPAPLVALVGGLAAVAAVTVAIALAVGPLTANGPRTPLVPDAFGGDVPVGSPAPGTPSAEPRSSPAASSPAANGPAASSDVAVFSIGDAIPLLDLDGAPIGDVTVVRIDPIVGTTAGGITLAVELRYAATNALTVDPSSWTARSSSGAVVGPASPSNQAIHPALPARLGAGQSRTGWLEFSLPDVPAALALDYGQFGATVFQVIAY